MISFKRKEKNLVLIRIKICSKRNKSVQNFGQPEIQMTAFHHNSFPKQASALQNDAVRF